MFCLRTAMLSLSPCVAFSLTACQTHELSAILLKLKRERKWLVPLLSWHSTQMMRVVSRINRYYVLLRQDICGWHVVASDFNRLLDKLLLTEVFYMATFQWHLTARSHPILLFHQAFSPKTPWTSFLSTESSSTGASSGRGAFFARPHIFLEHWGYFREQSPLEVHLKGHEEQIGLQALQIDHELSCPTENYESKWEASPNRDGTLKTFETTT